MAVIMRAAALVTGSAAPLPGITQTWWAPGTVGGSTADATDILARFRAAWLAIAGLMEPRVTIDFDPICLAVEASTGVLQGAFAGTDPTSVTGTATGDPLPLQTQGLIQLGTSTVISGRRVRGRLFLPGVVEGDNTSTGVPSGTYRSTATTAFGGLTTGGGTSSQLVVWHRPQNGVGGASPLVTSVSTSTKWAVLRSRRG